MEFDGKSMLDSLLYMSMLGEAASDESKKELAAAITIFRKYGISAIDAMAILLEISAALGKMKGEG